jgi:hypothetical protein
MNTNNCQLARSAWAFAAAKCQLAVQNGAELDALNRAFEEPTPANIRAAMLASFGKPWQALLDAALIEIAIATAGEIIACSDASR